MLERGNVQGLPCGTTLARVHFCGLAIFRVLQELIIAAENYFLRFLESPEQIIDDIFVFIACMDGSNIFKQQHCVCRLMFY